MPRALLLALLLTPLACGDDGNPNTFCPDPTDRRVFVKSIHFDARAATITPERIRSLDHTSTMMNELPSIEVELSGHTDDREKDAEELSLRRAQVLRQFLVERGVAGERMKVRGAGADEPIGDNETESGRAMNRRVDVTLLVP